MIVGTEHGCGAWSSMDRSKIEGSARGTGLVAATDGNALLCIMTTRNPATKHLPPAPRRDKKGQP